MKSDNGHAQIIHHTDVNQKIEVRYYDNEGHHFFTEMFDHMPLDQVEFLVNEWAEGSRKLEESV
jgi:hypothetical protein